MFKLILYLSISISYIFANSWEYHSSKDEMTGEVSYYASSPRANSTKQMNFPYHNVASWIGIGCRKGEQWAYFGFSKSPNLVGDKTKDGYNQSFSKVKIGDDIKQLRLTQTWGSKFLHLNKIFYNNSNYLGIDQFAEKIKKANSVLLEVNWHGNPNTYFKYFLKGSSKAIDKMQTKCGYKDRLRKLEKERIKKEQARKEQLKRDQELKKLEEKLAVKKKLEKFKERCGWHDRYFFEIGNTYGCSVIPAISKSFREKCEIALGKVSFSKDGDLLCEASSPPSSIHER